MKTAEQLSESRKQLTTAMNWLDARRRIAGERIAQIEQGYPQLLVKVATGEIEEAVLTDMAAELARLRGVMAEPIDKAAAILRDQIKLVDGKFQQVRSIQNSRDEDLEFRKFFNRILRQQGFRGDEEERLRQMGAGANRKDSVNRLCEELGEYKFKEAGTVPVRFEDVVTIQPFSEEPDNGVIKV